MICDVSKHQGAIDWSRLAPELDFVVIKANGKWANQGDPRYGENVAGAVAHGVPFHAYHYLYSLTEAEAKRDAGLFYRIVAGAERWPLFWVLDCEARWGVANVRARPIADAFEAELRRLARANGPGEIRVAVYVAQEKYHAYALDYDRYAYVWIPGYGEKYKPKMHCDIWQYTDKGRLPGISGDVDLDKLVSDKPMTYYTTEATDQPHDGGGTQMFTGKQLAAYAEHVYAHKDHWAYWYGTYGQKCTQSLYNRKSKQYAPPKYDHYVESRKPGYEKDIKAGRRCADCVGLIKSFFWTGGKYDTDPKYNTNHCPDKSANGMIAICKKTGPIKDIPDIPGLVVWKSGHIGIYVGNGYTVEMKGFAYDCKRNKVKDGPWTMWGMLPESMISYADEPIKPVEPEPVGDRDLKNGDEGADVKQLQDNLIELGYDCGRWGADGEFGDCTEQALEAFQRANGLPETGVYDAETRAAMEAALDAQDEPVESPKYVKIYGGNCYVRSAPNTNGKKLGVAHNGDVYLYQGQTSEDGWNLIDFKNANGWVSGKYSRLVE